MKKYRCGVFEVSSPFSKKSRQLGKKNSPFPPSPPTLTPTPPTHATSTPNPGGSRTRSPT